MQNEKQKWIQLEFDFGKNVKSLTPAVGKTPKERDKAIVIIACEEYRRWFEEGADSLKDKNLMIYRLKEICKSIWNWNIPPENEVAQAFKITRLKARGYLREIKSRYGYECNDILDDLVKEVLKKAKGGKKRPKLPEKYTLYIINPLVEYRISEILCELAKKEIEENRSDFEIMKKNKDCEYTYFIKPVAFKELRKYFNIK